MTGVRYKAIFFDRDGTLSQFSLRKERERDSAIGQIVGKPDLKVDHMAIFWRVWQMPGVHPVNTLEREDQFWRLWYKTILEDYGQGAKAERLAGELFERFCFYRCMELYPETLSVLQTLRGCGFKMAVISDTFPSLEESCRHLGIHGYFDAFTASSLVGAGKPDPRIFNAALQALGVRAEEAIFVDDTKEEADGARAMGFTAFCLDRRLAQPDFRNWTIGNLKPLVEFLMGERLE